MKQYLFFLIIIYVYLCSSCSKEKQQPYIPPENIISLITGDSTKVWKIAKRYNGKTRMNMGDCFLEYRQTFTQTGQVYDNNEHLMNCGPSLKGAYEIIKDSLEYTYIRISSDQIPALMNIQETYKDFRIFYASKDSLHISFSHTQFGTKRRISDYLVQENITVKDRNFHHR